MRVIPDMEVDTGLWELLTPTTYWIVIAASALVLAGTLYILHEKTLPAKVQTPAEA